MKSVCCSGLIVKLGFERPRFGSPLHRGNLSGDLEPVPSSKDCCEKSNGGDREIVSCFRSLFGRQVGFKESCQTTANNARDKMEDEAWHSDFVLAHLHSVFSGSDMVVT